MKLVVGLGNIGARYAHTRHNIGFMVADRLAASLSATWKPEPKLKSDVATASLDGEQIVLAKPQNMMNLSGEAIQRLLQHYKLTPADVWVIFDDVDVPFGRLRLRTDGISGSGHQGVNSTIAHIGNKFMRVKVGISLNDRSVEPSEVYVLKSFNEEEQAKLPQVIATSAAVVLQQLAHPSPQDTTFELI